jgi:diaminopimelate decarboxylase
LGIRFDFVNMGGGISIPYRPAERAFELEAFADRTIRLLAEFREAHGYEPRLFMECGRLVTGPHGVLVTKVLNVMSKHRELVGVDACLTSLMRPAMYPDSYNHISVVGVDVVGSVCENNDKFAEQVPLPPLEEGDLVLVHDTGAHGLAMGFQYNGRLRPKELLLRQDGTVELIRRGETVDDFLRTQLDFEPRLLRP